MSFAYDLRQWRSGQSFREHLAAHDPAVCGWVKRIVVHHTVNPTRDTWRGKPTMDGMVNYYKGLGWDAGPHLFIVQGAPDTNQDGIWQMTPLNARGIHAGLCNRDSIGIEVVGYYDRHGWPYRLAQLVYRTMGHFINWHGKLTVNDVIGHRDCKSPKTCPGSAISLSVVRYDLADIMKHDLD